MVTSPLVKRLRTGSPFPSSKIICATESAKKTLVGKCDEEKNLCRCDGVNGGIYCEFGLGDSYVSPLIREFYLVFNESWFNRSKYAYAKEYWAELTDAELFGQLEKAFFDDDELL